MAAGGAMTDLLERARRWAAGDPDPKTRGEVEELVTAGDIAGLEVAFAQDLTFGTAGIRGRVGPGPGQMNRAVVIRTTAGLATHLGDTAGHPVVVAFDARPTSEQFAVDAAAVLLAAGIPVVYFPTPTPTPLAAYAAKILGAAAAVVVTASHNPPEDNGYKVYGANAAQIIPPIDAEIARLIASAPPATDVPRDDPGSSDRFQLVPDDVFDRYKAEVEAVRPAKVESDLRIVYTPIHGCGGETVAKLLTAAGHRGMIPVVSQFAPDGTFPTVGFPNPEEPGALDLAVATAKEAGADLIIANDPDADRLAAVVPLRGEWRPLSGNDLGILLADFMLESPNRTEDAFVASSIVSSPMLPALARSRGARHVSTLTGFKWIVNAALHLEAAGEGTFLFGYEEALGYTVGDVVRDKDGISAALIFCDLVESLRRRGATVWDRLTELWEEVGVWASTQTSIRQEGPDGMANMAAAVERLAASPPSAVADLEVTSVTDFRTGEDDRPFWLGAQDLIELVFGGEGRALVRPSGTEPKLKIYVDLTRAAEDDPLGEQTALGERARSVADALAREVGR